MHRTAGRFAFSLLMTSASHLQQSSPRQRSLILCLVRCMKAQDVTRVLSLVVLLFMHSSCVPVPWRYSKSALVGAYEINYPFGSDTLILKPDDSYEQLFTAKDGRAFTNRGKWTLERRWHSQIRL